MGALGRSGASCDSRASYCTFFCRESGVVIKGLGELNPFCQASCWVKVGVMVEERKYTLEEANAVLPWLEDLLTRMVPLRDRLESQQVELMSLMQRRSGNGASSHDQEIVEIQKTMDDLAQELRGHLQDIADRGILVRDIVRGLVDFPSVQDGQDIFLCWLRGEPQIDFWHWTNEGFGSRKPL